MNCPICGKTATIISEDEKNNFISFTTCDGNEFITCYVGEKGERFVVKEIEERTFNWNEINGK